LLLTSKVIVAIAELAEVRGESFRMPPLLCSSLLPNDSIRKKFYVADIYPCGGEG